ncbi:S-adenosyl-L-methionine-dependent methyltransferase [Punctularia strigosozonata HHB-11173 SS5]|uniref:S-adenosyl-L-methionine-dependent methyltransferase n=1 Tax=Punctularia strigosozonata (strain HHB-11173) TaxID=741275 RepID=UPI0004416FEB|nr:S-adenosyl-L-methionine-dependent methyltransferase [Punctularia strigosozonata HHB-11173 SS5]EIN07303.1 S-adenosyl-L-methionine-dependent methyltransferase [Punctularia strigosozonata HHB-11173 SS5]
MPERRRSDSPEWTDADAYVGDDDDEFFRELDGRRFNAMVPRYLLPADEDEIRRYELFHRMFQFVADANYVGPVREVLVDSTASRRKRVLDVGTGSGQWAIEMADEFPKVDVVGCDCAPIQPREVPPNCTFELCDVSEGLPYPDACFDLVHARSIHIGISDYPRFIREAARVLRPGGLLILIEPDVRPDTILGKRPPSSIAFPTPSHGASGTPGWTALVNAQRRALERLGVDPDVPHKLGQIVVRTGAFDRPRTIALEADCPVGFHPKDPTLLSIGQLAWMNYDLLLPALRTYLASSDLPDWQIDVLIEDAQRDLYYPVVRLSCRLHIVHAIRSGHP